VPCFGGDQAQQLPMPWGERRAPVSAEVDLMQVRAQQCQQRAVALGEVRRAHMVAVELQPGGPSVAGMALYERPVIALWRLARRYVSERRFGALYLWAATPPPMVPRLTRMREFAGLPPSCGRCVRASRAG
jgi:hypothetical protein